MAASPDRVMTSNSYYGYNFAKEVHVASYPAFPCVKSPSIFHTVSDKNLTRGKAGYEAKVHVQY